jgi:hypothetical protein
MKRTVNGQSSQHSRQSKRFDMNETKRTKRESKSLDGILSHTTGSDAYYCTYLLTYYGNYSYSTVSTCSLVSRGGLARKGKVIRDWSRAAMHCIGVL